jgi:hypothetical protein
MFMESRIVNFFDTQLGQKGIFGIKLTVQLCKPSGTLPDIRIPEQGCMD